MKISGCAWCPQEGEARCDRLEHWTDISEANSTHNSCLVELYKNQTSCDCENQCSDGFEKSSLSCKGGNKVCGVCQDCPDGSFGDFCQCALDGSDRTLVDNPLKALPFIRMGQQDDLWSNSVNSSSMKIGFHHSIVPNGISQSMIKCNATYCMNTNFRGCYNLTKEDFLYDYARDANLVAIYGDQQLLPGTELTFRLTFCPLKISYWGTHETRFGFGKPLTKNEEYIFPTKSSSDLMHYFTEDAFLWGDEGFEDKKRELKNFDFRHLRKEGRSLISYTPKNITGVKYSLGYVSMNANTEIKLVVSDKEVIWSWEEFHTKRNPSLTKLNMTINMAEKEYFPIFLLPGCEKEGDFSAVEITSSKVTK